MEQKTETDIFIAASFRVIYLSLITIVSLVTMGGEEFTLYMASEDSPIQVFSVLGYFLAAFTALFLHWKGRISYGGTAAIILMAMALRELDFHDRFTTMGIMKTRFYISDTVPVTEKVIAALIMLFLLYIVLRFIWTHLRPFVGELQAKNNAALLALNGIVFTVISKLIDANSSFVVCILEETMELAIPYFFLLAMICHSRQAGNKSSAS